MRGSGDLGPCSEGQLLGFIKAISGEESRFGPIPVDFSPDLVLLW